MASETVYLITGANRGIGLGLVSSLLSRPNATIVATVRSDATPTDGLRALLAGKGSKLLILPLANDSDTSAATLIAGLPAHGITHIDTVVANAGSGTSFQSALTTSLSSLRDDFEVNTLGPIKLFQAAYPLLEESAGPKFVLMSSALGSITLMEGAPALSYGASKAAANYFVRKVHFEHKEIATLAIHPGWVKTTNGQNFANAVDVEEPPMTVEESVKAVLAQIDALEKSPTISGSFMSYNGTPMPW